jgi:hypothetical protein
MQLRGTRRRGGYDRGFVLSDHADWPACMRAIAATGAQRVIVTHGSVPVMVRWLSEQGLEARGFATEYGDEDVAGGGFERAQGRAHEAPLGGPRLFERALMKATPRCTASSTKVQAKQARCTSAQRAAADAAWAVYFPGRRQAAPAGADQAAARAGAASWPPACPSGCSTSATRPSATWPRPSRCCCPAPLTRTLDVGLAAWVEQHLLPCAACRPTTWRSAARQWASSRPQERFLVYFKLITGGFRVGVSKLQVHAGAGGSQRRRRQARGAAPDGLHHIGKARPRRRALR